LNFRSPHKPQIRGFNEPQNIFFGAERDQRHAPKLQTAKQQHLVGLNSQKSKKKIRRETRTKNAKVNELTRIIQKKRGREIRNRKKVRSPNFARSTHAQKIGKKSDKDNKARNTGKNVAKKWRATSLFFALSTFFKVKLKSVRIYKIALVLAYLCVPAILFLPILSLVCFSNLSLSLSLSRLLLTQFRMFGKHKKKLLKKMCKKKWKKSICKIENELFACVCFISTTLVKYNIRGQEFQNNHMMANPLTINHVYKV